MSPALRKVVSVENQPGGDERRECFNALLATDEADLKRNNYKARAGFTLAEAIIALAVFAVLSAGTLQAWRYTSQNTLGLLEKSNAFENARAAMDAFTINLQLADEITLETLDDGTLVSLTVRESDTSRPMPYRRPYKFEYYKASGRLAFGGHNEFAAGLSEVKLFYNEENTTMTIKIKTDETPAVILESAVDMRMKVFT